MAALGSSTVAAATPGGEGTVNAKLRLMTQQADTFTTSGGSVLTTLQDAAAEAVSGTVLDVRGYRSLLVHVTGTGSGTVTFQGSIDGSNWFNITMRDTTTTAAATLVATVTSGVTAGAGAFVLPIDYGALAWFRANITTYTGGAWTVKARKYVR